MSSSLLTALQLAYQLLTNPNDYDPMDKMTAIQEIERMMDNPASTQIPELQITCLVHGTKCLKCGVALELEHELLRNQRDALIKVVEDAKRFISAYPALNSHAASIGFFKKASDVMQGIPSRLSQTNSERGDSAMRTVATQDRAGSDSLSPPLSFDDETRRQDAITGPNQSEEKK